MIRNCHVDVVVVSACSEALRLVHRDKHEHVANERCYGDHGRTIQFAFTPFNASWVDKSQFLEPPRDTKIVLKNREVREIGPKIKEKFIHGTRKLVRKIGRFEQLRA